MPSRYSFVEYSPDWPAEFRREAAVIGALLGPELVDVHHIGSTSVPGLAAKPVIDMLPVVRGLAFVDAHKDRFLEAGYRAWGEYGLAGRRYFTRDRDEFRTHNVHLYEVDHPDVERHLAFSSYLRAHPQARDEYDALKRAVYAHHSADIAAYSDGKDAWIKRVEAAALLWFRSV